MPHLPLRRAAGRPRRRSALGLVAVAATVGLVACAASPTRTATPDPAGVTSTAEPTRSATSSSTSTGATSSSGTPAATEPSSQTTETSSQQQTDQPTTPEPTSNPTKKPVPSCAELAASLTRSEQIGQLLMVGIGSSGPTSSQSRILARSHAGSVILLGNSTAGARSVRRLSARIHGVGGRPDGVALMLTVDQEGGKVQRLRGSGFDTIPSARSQSRMSIATLTARSRRWSRQLQAAGIDADLAPVADVVPRNMERVNQPIGVLQRGYGPNPVVVANRVGAFVSGMHAGGTATAVKHFPGLGRVRGNTDFTSHVVDTSTTRHDRALKGFAAGVNAGVDMVMVSSAYYDRIDARHRAAFSSTIIKGMIRNDLDYDGVVISDDLSARALQDLSPGKRAVFFLGAGGDLIIVGNPASVAAMVTGIKREAASHPNFRAELEHKAARVLRMKARRGLTHCG